jgi:hypothetical protein
MLQNKYRDSRGIREFGIKTLTKGFVSETTIDGSTVKEFFQFKEIHQVIHHPDVGVEIVGYNDKHRVFYNDVPGKSQELYDAINGTMQTWMNSNLN